MGKPGLSFHPILPELKFLDCPRLLTRCGLEALSPGPRSRPLHPFSTAPSSVRCVWVTGPHPGQGGKDPFTQRVRGPGSAEGPGPWERPFPIWTGKRLPEAERLVSQTQALGLGRPGPGPGVSMIHPGPRTIDTRARRVTLSGTGNSRAVLFHTPQTVSRRTP